MLAVLLALGASLGWGVSDFLGGLKARSAPLLSVLLVSQATALVVVAVLVAARGVGPPNGTYLLWAAAAGAGEAVAIAALYRGLSVGTMSVVAPVAATAPVVPVAAGLVLGQVPGLSQSIGLGLALVGLVITSCQPRSGGADTARLGPSICYGLLAALGFGAFFIALDRASEDDIRWALLTARLTSVAAITTIMVIRTARGNRLAVRRADLPTIALVGVLIVTADSLYALATTRGLVGIVAVVGSLHTVVTMALARIWLDERLARIQQVGIATSLCGVLALAAT
ncbi:DMT family transporter [Actinomadura alba]|uniref:DMT family transporter n=1 Tax=Actinomadura alba TaxID=406431 RepID=A0ABR7LR12_9ACTN|nr:DMT family transporter [Actinomadura alba]MBC6467287.1 DMT family transporter [Actinomadura alba]